MRLSRPLGVRAHLLAAMVVVALASVAVTAVLINRAVDGELRHFSHRDLRFSAATAAEMAAAVYLESDDRWPERPVSALRTIASAHGDAIVVLGRDGRPAPGSAAGVPPDGERAPVIVDGHPVGTVVVSHPLRGGIDVDARRMDERLQRRMDVVLLAAGLAAGLVALLFALAVALRFARPLERLTEVASRIGAGEVDTRASGTGGGREMARLAQTMDRLAATLRRQDELRRATAADVTHELRGALVGVVGRTEALRHGLAHDQDAALRQIEADARRLHRLVDDVERLAEAQRPGLLVRKRPIDVDEVVASCVARHADRARALSIALKDRLGRARVEADPERLAQVVDNLLSNALRYTDPGGRVTVRLHARGDEAVIEVADSGIGIAPEHVDRIFDRFWRGPQARARAADGSGVGLALLAELVRAHDGRVEVASRPGRGSTFSVLLPLCEAAPARPAPRRRGSTPAVADGVVLRGDLRSAAARHSAAQIGLEAPEAPAVI